MNVSLVRSVVRLVTRYSKGDDSPMTDQGKRGGLLFIKKGNCATREVIEYCNDPDRQVSGSKHRDAKLDQPLRLAAGEIADLEAFLDALTDDRFGRDAVGSRTANAGR